MKINNNQIYNEKIYKYNKKVIIKKKKNLRNSFKNIY